VCKICLPQGFVVSAFIDVWQRIRAFGKNATHAKSRNVWRQCFNPAESLHRNNMQLSEGFEKTLGVSESLRVCFNLVFGQTFKFL
jgi:hypothetical protein